MSYSNHNLGNGIEAGVTITDAGYFDIELETGCCTEHGYDTIGLDRNQLRELIKIVARYDPELVAMALDEGRTVE